MTNYYSDENIDNKGIEIKPMVSDNPLRVVLNLECSPLHKKLHHLQHQ